MMFPLIASAALLGLYVFFKGKHGVGLWVDVHWPSSRIGNFIHLYLIFASPFVSSLVFSASSVNFLLTLYFFVLGVFALAHLLSPIVAKISPDSLKKPTYQLLFFKKDDEEELTMVRSYMHTVTY